MLGRVWLAIRLPSFRPASGWHIEPWFNTSREISDAYVHNGADIKQWRIDVATSFLWNFLTRQQQREILDGKTSIENFRTAEEIDEVTIDPTIIARPSTTHMMTQRKLTMTIPAEVRMSATQSPSGVFSTALRVKTSPSSSATAAFVASWGIPLGLPQD
jgi:hypothetical protein